MGDRGCAGIEFSDGTVIYLYTHNEGRCVKEKLAIGLLRVKQAGRLGDESYAARLIFQEWTKGNEDDDLGYGMSPWVQGDCYYPVPIVHFKTDTVSITGAEGKKDQTIIEFIHGVARNSQIN